LRIVRKVRRGGTQSQKSKVQVDDKIVAEKEAEGG
jgi:hypothetical protein